MYLYELENNDPLQIKLIIAMDQLKTNLEKDPNLKWTVDELIGYLQRRGITLDKPKLLDMIKNPPLNTVISNIQGDDIIFKGKEKIKSPVDKNKEIVAKMADKAKK